VVTIFPVLIVTSDHETGGLSVPGNNGSVTMPEVSWFTTGHTGVDVNSFEIIDKIYSIRNTRVMLDSDLVELYGVEAKKINEAEKSLRSKISTLENRVNCDIYVNSLFLAGRSQTHCSPMHPKAFSASYWYLY